MIRLHRATTVLALTLLTLACDTQGITVVAEVDRTFGFESGMAGWTPVTDASPDGSATVELSSTAASAGSSSVRIAIDDAGGGVALITREFALGESDRAYDVELSFDLATADGDGTQPWALRAGAAGVAPDASTVFVDAGSTQSDDATLSFEPRTATLQGTTSSDGSLWVTVGVSQESAGDREYFIDRLRVVLTRR